jgi:3-methylcrotonyl-CoA carboxylase alpha subunit
MRFVGVPVLPGYEGNNQDLRHLQLEARRLGLPLIIKPAAGGGGKGMRIIHEEAELAEGLSAARRLAESAFGDGSLLLERFLPAPRHIEVQIFADSHGHYVHLGDRDCSIQRRHQKLIEEAPAPALPEDVRTRLRAAALVVAREIGYVSAGTVEFLFDGREFYFMEMNTRLQVEHTVTEAVTGLDLVEWQLRIADGEQLPLEQSQIRLDGHAIEARVCAEDPERDFLPSAGNVRLLEWPHGDSIRVDAGFVTGDRVPESYDSLLGKVIAWAPVRAEAAARLAGALDRTYCAGIRTNEHWLARILHSESFLEVRHSIAFLQQHAADFLEAPTADERALAIGALAISAAGLERPISETTTRTTNPNPWQASDGFTPNLAARVKLSLAWRDQLNPVEIGYVGGQPTSLDITGHPVSVSDPAYVGGFYSATLNGVRSRARVFVNDVHVHVWLPDAHYDFRIDDPRSVEFSASASRGGLSTPLPGVVVSVGVTTGQAVAAGQVLMVIEAMKMEHTITAPYAGVVQTIHFARGDRVPEGSELLELAAAAPDAAPTAAPTTKD